MDQLAAAPHGALALMVLAVAGALAVAMAGLAYLGWRVRRPTPTEEHEGKK